MIGTWNWKEYWLLRKMAEWNHGVEVGFESIHRRVDSRGSLKQPLDLCTTAFLDGQWYH